MHELTNDQPCDNFIRHHHFPINYNLPAYKMPRGQQELNLIRKKDRKKEEEIQIDYTFYEVRVYFKKKKNIYLEERKKIMAIKYFNYIGTVRYRFIHVYRDEC